MGMGMLTLVLRDVHVPPSPSWWPLAPGWWLSIVAIVLFVVGVTAWRLHRHRRLQAWRRWFDATSEENTPAAQVAAMSELLRRAARQRDASADRLEGEAWLRFLDGGHGHAFTQGPGRLLLDGGYRRHVDAAELAAASTVARARFLELMAGSR